MARGYADAHTCARGSGSLAHVPRILTPWHTHRPPACDGHDREPGSVRGTSIVLRGAVAVRSGAWHGAWLVAGEGHERQARPSVREVPPHARLRHRQIRP